MLVPVTIVIPDIAPLHCEDPPYETFSLSVGLRMVRAFESDINPHDMENSSNWLGRKLRAILQEHELGTPVCEYLTFL